MPYQPLKNEMIISCKYAEGGTISASGHFKVPLQLVDVPIIIGVHDNNIWIEKEGVFGFSIDKNIALCLLRKLLGDKEGVVGKDAITNHMAEIFEGIVNDTQTV